MTCKSCLQKAYEKYRSYGLSEKEALFMARKLVRRVEKRRKKEKIQYFYRYVNRFLWKWTFLCQWKATIFHRSWIGRGYNPDYTQVCAGTCAAGNCPRYNLACIGVPDCVLIGGICAKLTCGCPVPMANSHQISDSCGCTQHALQACTTCAGPVGSKKCSLATFSCDCTGTCGYNCDASFHWDGANCVPDAVATVLRRLRMHAGL